MIEEIYILGNHIQGLGISRIVSRLGYKVRLFNNSIYSVARFSNTCNEFIKFKSEKHLLLLLLKRNIANKKALLIPTNDLMVAFLQHHYDDLKGKYHISGANAEITNIALNKRETYKAAIQADIPIPESYFPNNKEDLKSISANLSYPVIIKPAEMYVFYKQAGKKVFLCKDEDSLFKNYIKALKIIPADQVIIQEMLQGGAKNLYSFAAFVKNGKVYGSFIANRIRQKPMDFGVATTFAITVLNDKIEEQAKRFLKEINYSGLAEVEFMYDEKAETYKLIEINPRTWKWHSMANIVGINLIKMMIDSMDGKEIEKQRNTIENLAWIEQLTDIFISWSEILKGRMSYKDYRISLRLKKEYAAFDKSDLLPSIMYIIMAPYLYLTR